MKRDLATWRMWGTGSIWVADEPEPAPVQATVIHVVHVVHHYLPLPDGQAPELPQQRAAITGGGSTAGERSS